MKFGTVSDLSMIGQTITGMSRFLPAALREAQSAGI